MRILAMLILVSSLAAIAPAHAEEGDGPFIRAFYPDDRPALVGYLGHEEVPVAVSCPVALVPAVAPLAAPTVFGPGSVSGALAPAAVAYPVVSGYQVVKTRVPVGPIYTHPAFPETVLFWKKQEGRWIRRSAASGRYR